MDDQDRNVVIIALCILAGVAFLALLALLLDPLLFHYDDDDEDEDYESLPRWTVEYPDAEAYVAKQREYQRKLEIYEKERQAYEQQERADLREKSQQQPEHDEVPLQQPSEQMKEANQASTQTEVPIKESEIAEHEVDRSLPEDMRSLSSSVDSMTSSARNQLEPNTNATHAAHNEINVDDPQKLNRQLQESLEPAESLFPFDESEATDNESHFEPPSLVSPKQSESSRSSSAGEVNNLVEEKDSTQSEDVEDTITKGPTEQQSLNDTSHEIVETKSQESPPFVTAPEAKAALPVTAVSEKDATFVSPLKQSTTPLPEMAPPVQNRYQPGVALPTKRSQQAAPANATTQVNSLKSVIPRYSHKTERQRFIIMNTLILVIIGSITSVLVLRFYF